MYVADKPEHSTASSGLFEGAGGETVCFWVGRRSKTDQDASLAIARARQQGMAKENKEVGAFAWYSNVFQIIIDKPLI